MDLLVDNGSDAVRYWAASGRPGTDLAFDPAQIRVGRRLATKLLNASKFALGLGAGGAGSRSPSRSTRRCSRGCARWSARPPRRSRRTTTRPRCRPPSRSSGRSATTTSSWSRNGRTATRPAADSARAALATALSVQLRLFAPFLPYVTEEVWSWWRYGSVHRATWPTVHELAGRRGRRSFFGWPARRCRRCAGPSRSASCRCGPEVPLAEVLGPAAMLERLALAADDLRAAGRIGKLDLLPDRTPELCCRLRASERRATPAGVLDGSGITRRRRHGGQLGRYGCLANAGRRQPGRCTHGIHVRRARAGLEPPPTTACCSGRRRSRTFARCLGTLMVAYLATAPLGSAPVGHTGWRRCRGRPRAPRRTPGRPCGVAPVRRRCRPRPRPAAIMYQAHQRWSEVEQRRSAAARKVRPSTTATVASMASVRWNDAAQRVLRPPRSSCRRSRPPAAR